MEDTRSTGSTKPDAKLSHGDANAKRLPEDWKKQRRAIKTRSAGKCEGCGAERLKVGAHDLYGVWLEASAIESMNSTEGMMRFGPDFPILRAIRLKIALVVRGASYSVETCKNLCQRCRKKNYTEITTEEERREKARHERAVATRRKKLREGQIPLDFEGAA